MFLQGLVTCIRFTWVLVRMHIHRPDTRPAESEFGGRAPESAVLFLSCAELFLCLGLNFQSLPGYAHLNVFSSHTLHNTSKTKPPLAVSNSVLMLVSLKSFLESLLFAFHHFYLISLLAFVPSTGKDSNEHRHGSCPQRR